MQSIFRYPGAKNRPAIQQLILRHAPRQFREYREPFLGSGGIGVSIAPHIPRWFNDINADLMAVWFAMRDRPKEFITLCRNIPMARPDEPQILSRTGQLHNRRFTELANRLLNDPDADRALRFFFLNRVLHSATAAYPHKRKRVSVCAERKWDMVFSSSMELFAQHIQGIQLTCGDFVPLFRAPGQDVFIVADPPYGCDTDAPLNSKLYARGLAWNDHERLAKEVHDCSHHVLVNYDDHPRIRAMYQDMYIHEASWPYSGSSARTKKRGRELIITNYRVEPVAMPLIDWDNAA